MLRMSAGTWITHRLTHEMRHKPFSMSECYHCRQLQVAIHVILLSCSLGFRSVSRARPPSISSDIVEHDATICVLTTTAVFASRFRQGVPAVRRQHSWCGSEIG